MKKSSQFTIVYDEKQKKYAVILNTLVSEIEDLKSIDKELRKFENQSVPTSNDFIVYIGKESTKELRNSFNDKYAKYGIHVGYRGTKAWIYCNKIKWNWATYLAFHAELMDLFVNMGMNPESVKEKIYHGIEELQTEGTITVPSCLTTTQEMFWDTMVEATFLTKIKNYFKRIFFKLFHAESNRLHQQYSFAILLFYKDYIKDYLDLKKVQI